MSLTKGVILDKAINDYGGHYLYFILIEAEAIIVICGEERGKDGLCDNMQQP